MPHDPFGCGPLRYRRTVDGSSLYGVGYDGDDDLGKLPPTDARGIYDRPNGDMTLDAFVVPAEQRDDDESEEGIGRN